MDDLFKQLEEEMANCKSDMKDFSKGLSTCLTMYSIEDKSINEETKKLYQTTQAPGFSFPKNSRFIQSKDEPIQIPLSYSIDVIMHNLMFVEPKPLDQPALQPNFDFVKKKIQSALITESRIDDTSTQASFSTVGPGSYEPRQFQDLSNQKQSGWAKSNRFPKQESNEQTPINPNYDAVKPAIKVPKIAKPIKKNKMLLQKEEIEKMNEQLRLSQYRKRPLEIDLGIRPNAKTVVIKQAHTDIQSHPLGSKMRRFLIRKLMEDLQLVNPGPGQYEMQEEHQPCMVVWRSHSTERRIPPEGPTPGPDYYYSKDDLIKNRAIQVVFGKEERIKVLKKKDLDMRPDLEIIDDLIRTNAPQPVRWDVKPTQPRVTFEMDRAALGLYDPQHDQVEPRVLGTKIAPLNEKNDRINIIDPTKGRDFNDYDEQLYPSLDPIKPAVKTFKYHEESDIHPQHVPDKELYPEKHKFYDVNLDVVREELVKDIALAGQKGRGLKEWLNYVDDLKMFQGYMDRRNRMPHLGEYDVQYGQVDKEVVAVNFNRYVEIDHEPITKPDGAVDGDNLILHPDKPQKHIANIDFEKQSDPRQEEKVPEQELLLNVDYTQVKPRVKGIPDFEKQLDRPEGPQQKEQELYLEVKHTQVEKRVVGDANFEKQQERNEDIRYQHKVDDKPLLLDAKLQTENKRTAVQMNSQTKRFLYKKESDKEKMPGAVNLSKLERGEKVVRPNVPQVRIGSKQNINIKNKK